GNIQLSKTSSSVNINSSEYQSSILTPFGQSLFSTNTSTSSFGGILTPFGQSLVSSINSFVANLFTPSPTKKLVITNSELNETSSSQSSASQPSSSASVPETNTTPSPSESSPTRVSTIAPREFLGVSESDLASQLSGVRGNLLSIISSNQLDTNAQLNSFRNDLSRISTQSSNAQSTAQASIRQVAVSQPINTLNNITVNNGLNLASGNLTIGSGSLTSSGTLSIGGNATISGNLVVSGSITGPTSLSLGTTTVTNFTSTNTSTSSFAGTLTISGQAIDSYIPITPHTFSSWSPGAAGGNMTQASLVINPSSSVGDGNLIGAGINGSTMFLVDSEGDVYANSFTSVGSNLLSTTTAATFNVTDNTTLGDAVTDVITNNAGTIYFNNSST
ncbi:MAG: hypothetical protein AAB796_01020, partial [Patescibacteria group bacterium]